MSNKKEISVPEVKDDLSLEVGSDTVAEEKQKSREAVMYLGPTIVGVIRHSTVFKEGVLPEKVQCKTASYDGETVRFHRGYPGSSKRDQ